MPFVSPRKRPAVCVHRRPKLLPEDVTEHDDIPVTRPVRTLIDLAARYDQALVERAINEADRLNLTNPEALYAVLDRYSGQRGVGVLREMLGKRSFRLTDSALERRFLRLVADVSLPTPLTRQRVNGFRVDFYWPDLKFVVETDGLRYHRTPAQQTRDRLRDQRHTVAGFTHLRFTHAQIRFESDHVRQALLVTARRLGCRPAPPAA